MNERKSFNYINFENISKNQQANFIKHFYEEKTKDDCVAEVKEILRFYKFQEDCEFSEIPREKREKFLMGIDRLITDLEKTDWSFSSEKDQHSDLLILLNQALDFIEGSFLGYTKFYLPKKGGALPKKGEASLTFWLHFFREDLTQCAYNYFNN